MEDETNFAAAAAATAVVEDEAPPRDSTRDDDTNGIGGVGAGAGAGETRPGMDVGWGGGDALLPQDVQDIFGTSSSSDDDGDDDGDDGGDDDGDDDDDDDEDEDGTTDRRSGDDPQQQRQLVNDDGRHVSPGTDTEDLFYCGAELGVDVIPGSDGRCGPDDGLQCPSCRRFQIEGKLDALGVRFPSLLAATVVGGGGGGEEEEEEEEEDSNRGVRILVAALRATGGSYGSAGRYLEELGAVAVGGAVAGGEGGRGGDDDADEPSPPPDPAPPIPDAVAELATWPYGTFEPLTLPEEEEGDTSASASASSPPPDRFVLHGHRMVRIVTDEASEQDSPSSSSSRCILCASPVPSPTGGRYRCEACRLCEGCIACNPGTVLHGTCPALPNGGSHHVHPLDYTPDRPNRRCDMEGRTDGAVRDGVVGCNSTAAICWSCSLPGCGHGGFDLCCWCVARPLPGGCTRRFGVVGSILGAAEAGGADDEGRGGGDGGGGDRLPQQFDASLAERGAAARWEGSAAAAASGRGTATAADGGVAPEVLVGAGVVGRMAPSRPDIPAAAAERGERTAPRPAETRLSEEATAALEDFRSMATSAEGGGGGGDEHRGEATMAAAADVSHVEDILQRAEALDDRLTRRALCEAIAAGRLGIAGTLLLSRTYAPVPKRARTSGDGEAAAPALPHSSSNDEDRCCGVCADVIDSKTSPDGAVGCLGGHAMHASCASDLLLGGGLCPTCRQPIFVSRVAESEIKSAVETVNMEMERSRMEEEEKLRAMQEALVADGRTVALSVGDTVRIDDDEERVSQVQSNDVNAGGWADDMALWGGLEGDVTEIVVKDGRAVAAKVRSIHTNPGHILRPIPRGQYGRNNFTCVTCSMVGPSRQTGTQGCFLCQKCVTCCTQRQGHRSCRITHEWTWSLSLLTLVRQSSTAMSWLDDAAKTVEKHMTRLRAELSAVKAAREKVKEMTRLSIPNPSSCTSRALSAQSSSAFREGTKHISPSDWVRARHLLLLARQWGDSADAKAKRASLYSAVRNGEIDHVARIVRRHNARQMIDKAMWADAVAGTSEYIVVPTARVELRAFPDAKAPKTGYVLEPGTRFCSKRECLDTNGCLWLHVADMPIEISRKAKAGVSTKHIAGPHSLIGVRVCRGENWHYGNQDGASLERGKEGIIRAVTKDQVIVQWEASGKVYHYRVEAAAPYCLLFAHDPPPPPQGWMRVRHGGPGSPAFVTRGRSALRCFACGDGLVPTPIFGGEGKFSTAKDTALNKGERLLVAATLEPVEVESVDGGSGRVLCSFPNVASLTNEEDSARRAVDAFFWYRPEDLVYPKQKKTDRNLGKNDDESRIVQGKLRTRRELVLMSNGNEIEARNAWDEAACANSNDVDASGTEECYNGMEFASCARGHLLHARCLQSALLAGRRCPAPGCTEPLWVPPVRKINSSDASCCGGSDRGVEAEAEALREAGELAGHAAAVAARAAEEGPLLDAPPEGFESRLKMCPACCSGPLFNENCADMNSHHGECTASLMGSDRDSCTENGRFRATAADIAERMTHLSPSKSVADLLPRCPKHNVLVMFNGCLSCGHLFTDIGWNAMPDWDSKAKALLELDVKKRNASRLLTEQVRKEAAMLQFERDALWALEGGTDEDEVKRGAGDGLDEEIKPPPLPPPPPTPGFDAEHSIFGDEGDY